MNNADSFMNSLKAIGFPQVNAYKSEDFESLILDEELKPILESICDLNENNVLTPEELAEYAAISPAELAYFEKLAEDETFFTSDESDSEKCHEVQYLEEYLALVMEEKNSLQKQKQILKSHESLLLEEKERYENELIDAKKQFENYTVHIVPQAEAELASNLKSLVNVIAELQALVADSDGNSKVLPLSICKDMDSYFDNEKKIVKHMKNFIQKQFEVHDNTTISLKVSGYLDSKLLREVHFLRNVVKTCKIEEFSAYSEKCKYEAIVKFYEKHKYFSYIFNNSPSQIWIKLSEEIKLNEQLKEKEKVVKLRLLHAVSELVNAQCSEIGIAYSEEIIQCCNRNIEKMKTPLEHLISQRSRLELVVLYLNSYRKSFDNLKCLVESTSSFIEKERTILGYMKDLSEEKKLVQESNGQNNALSDSSTLLTVYKILNEVEDQHLCFVSCEDVLKRTNKLFEDQARFEKLQDEKLHHLHLMEEQSAGLEKYVYKGKQFSKLLEAQTTFNIGLNTLDLKMSRFTKTISETEADINEKEKSLERSENLKLARHLYIDAFLDPAHYEQQIQKIKLAYENELDSSFNQSIT